MINAQLRSKASQRDRQAVCPAQLTNTEASLSAALGQVWTGSGLLAPG
jgi:hypothetical protein